MSGRYLLDTNIIIALFADDTVVKDNLGSNATISLAPARKGRGSAINITYDLKEGGWAGISREIDPQVLYIINGLNFSYFGMDKQNTLELRLVNDNGTEIGTSWKPAIQSGNWQYLQALLRNFECLGPDEKCSAEGDVLNFSKVKKLEIIISNRPKDGDSAGHGKVNVDHIVGVMNIPPGSPWAGGRSPPGAGPAPPARRLGSGSG
jgi:hypothetical protein